MKAIYLASILLAQAGTIYNITDLGTLGGTSAQAFGLSSNGFAAGAASTAFGYQHAFVWNGSGMTDLTLNSGANEGMAAAINAAGLVAGTQFIEARRSRHCGWTRPRNRSRAPVRMRLRSTTAARSPECLQRQDRGTRS